MKTDAFSDVIRADLADRIDRTRFGSNVLRVQLAGGWSFCRGGAARRD